MEPSPTLRERVSVFVETVISDSAFAGPFQPVILNLFRTKFLDKVTDEQLRQGLTGIRDNVLPWLLGEKDMPNEDTHQE